MKKIGLVGGTGPESTLMYYKELNSRIDRMTSEKTMPEIAIESVNFRSVWNMVTEGNYDLLTDHLSEKVNNLVRSDAEVVSLTAATMHIVIDRMVEKTGVNLVSIPQAVCDAATAKGYKKVGLIGTIFTMEKDYMKKPFTSAGIDVVIPKQTERQLIAERIYKELGNGIVKESTLREFQQIIERMRVDNNIEALILGCTELPLLLNNSNCPVPCLDSVDIHIEKLIEMAMA
jgi:aspartate racemase